MPRLSFHCTEKKQHSSFHSFEISSFCVCMQSTSRGQRDARAHTHLSVALASPVAIGGAFARQFRCAGAHYGPCRGQQFASRLRRCGQ